LYLQRCPNNLLACSRRQKRAGGHPSILRKRAAPRAAGGGQAVGGGERRVLRDAGGAPRARDGRRVPAERVGAGQREPGRHAARVGPRALPLLPHDDHAGARPVRLARRGPGRRGAPGRACRLVLSNCPKHALQVCAGFRGVVCSVRVAEARVQGRWGAPTATAGDLAERHRCSNGPCGSIRVHAGECD